ncbi:alpha/beta fold hydrolase [Sphaerimonospora mesophila]|uniref:alpha/beta fold hydrolase n=1 Tax=Sphaerimonospora mesophila TaxID=37483 RepID=UPI000A4BE55E
MTAPPRSPLSQPPGTPPGAPGGTPPGTPPAWPRLHPLTRGDDGGDVVVLVHGMEDEWRGWTALAGLLDPGWRLYAAEMPWKAGSDHAWRRYGTPGGWLRAALASLDAPADLLIGHSLGANAVLEALTGGPSPAAARAVLVTPFYCPPELEISWPVFERALRDFEQIIREGLELRLGRRLGRIDPDVAESMLAKMIDRIGPVGFTVLFDQFLATAELDLAAVTVPSLVIAGGLDPALDGGRAAALGRRLPYGEIAVEPDFGHFCQVNQAEAVAAHVRSFAERVRVPAPPGVPTREENR